MASSSPTSCCSSWCCPIRVRVRVRVRVSVSVRARLRRRRRLRLRLMLRVRARVRVGVWGYGKGLELRLENLTRTARGHEDVRVPADTQHAPAAGFVYEGLLV